MSRSFEHQRRSLRLRGYDYSQSGWYFVTLCLQNRQCLLGVVRDGAVHLSPAGRMIEAVWQQMPARFPTLLLDVYVIMPNHIHAIGTIVDLQPTAADNRAVGAGLVPAPRAPEPTPHPHEGHPKGVPLHDPGIDVGAGLVPAHLAPAQTAPRGDPQGVRGPALGEIIGAFKSLTTNAYSRGVRDLGWPAYERRLWQRNYYEHIIRDEASLQRIQEYIRSNPARWMEDRENPERTRRRDAAPAPEEP